MRFSKLYLLISAFPVLLYFFVLYKFSVNIPFFDDHALKGFVSYFVLENRFLARVNMLLAQHNEHRILITRILALVAYYLNGQKISFVGMMFLGNGFLFLLSFVFLRFKDFFKKPLYNFLFSLTIFCVIFSFAYHENTFWGMASIQNFGVVALSFMVIYKLSISETRLNYNTIIWAFLAVYTSGNGFLVLIVGLIILIIKQNWKGTFIWICFSVIAGVTYFFSYTSPLGNPKTAIFTFPIFFKALTVFCGSFFDFNSTSNLEERLRISSFLGGVLLIVLFVFLLVQLRKIWTKSSISHLNYFVSGGILFVLGTALITVYARLGFGLDVLLTSRYKIYSGILVLLVFYTVMAQSKSLYVATSIAFVAFLTFCLHFYFAFGEIVYHRNFLISAQYNSANASYNSKVKVPYLSPKTLLSNFKVQSQSDTLTDLKVSLDEVNGLLSISSDRLLVKDSVNEGIFVCLTDSTNKNYIFALRPNRNKSKKSFLKSLNYWNTGFEGQISENDLPHAQYKLSIVHAKSGAFIGFLTKVEMIFGKFQKEKPKNW